MSTSEPDAANAANATPPVGSPGAPPVTGDGLPCPHCGHDLRGGRPGDVCPGCGQPVAAVPERAFGSDPDTDAVDAAGVVRIDRPCVRCGCNVRGLHRAAACPECGAPVEKSVAGNWLCHSDPRYVRRLARGARWVRWGLAAIAIAFVAVFGLGMLASVLSTALPDWLTANPPIWLAFVLLPVFAASILLGALGVYLGAWFLTSPDPGVLAVSGQLSARRLARACLFLAVVGAVVTGIVDATGPPWAVMATFACLAALIGALGVVGVCAYFIALRKLTLRIAPEHLKPHNDVPGTCRKLANVAGLVLGLHALDRTIMAALMCVPALAGLLPTPAAGSPAAAPAPPPAVSAAPAPQAPLAGTQPANVGSLLSSQGAVCVRGVVSLGILILVVAAVSLHGQLHRVLKGQAELAEQYRRAAGTKPALTTAGPAAGTGSPRTGASR